MRKTLSMKQTKFIAEYIKSGNGTKAAIKAGYSPKTAQEIASENLSKPLIAEKIASLKKQIESKAVMTKQRALEIISEIAETDLSDFLTVGSDGVTFFDFGKDTTKRKALRKVKTKTVRDEAGNTVIETMFNELELEDKVRAIERLSKMMGWDTPEKQEVNLSGTSIEQVLKDIAESGGKWWRRRSVKNGLPHQK